jgi:hypothetical protein
MENLVRHQKAPSAQIENFGIHRIRLGILAAQNNVACFMSPQALRLAIRSRASLILARSECISIFDLLMLEYI